MQDERGDVPAHDEDTDGYSDKRSADRTYIIQVLRGQEQGVSAESMHEIAVHRTEKYYPE